ncbi:hypothetical protein CPC08DRAFT_725333 [Agrocybe pediades]|nr:hypothetical protein CPC08DRAFT_725333 [Agrocybe pediades]
MKAWDAGKPSSRLQRLRRYQLKNPTPHIPYSMKISLKFAKALLMSSLPAIAAGQQLCTGGRTPQCCDRVLPASSNAAQALLGLLGIVVPNSGSTNIGVNCFNAAIQIVCKGQVVCCLNNSFAPTVSIDCI